jgi:sarcosine oxidase subunit beta
LIGDDVEFLPTGHIRICFRQDEVGILESYARDARAYGLELELLSQNMLRARFPFLSPATVAGSLSPLDGHANPRLAAPAFARAAARHGAAILERTEVLSLERSGGDFRIETREAGSVRAPVLLLAAGAWSGRFSAALGEPLSLIAQGPQLAATEPLPYMIGPSIGIATKFPEEAVYMRQVRRGNVIFGGGLRGPAHADIRRAYIDPTNTLHQLRFARRTVPALASASVIRTWSGIEGYTDDELPVIGPSPTVPGLFYAFGFCGHGFQLGPGTGDVLAELIDTGRTATPLEPFSMRRFLSGRG